MKKAYGYVRVSGKGQLEGDGFDRQEEKIQAFATEHKYDIAGMFREKGVSGTKGEDERVAFKEMVSEILRNGVNTILVESLDRLARGYGVQEQLLIFLVSKGIDLISVNTGENVTEAVSSDPMRKAMVQMQSVFSELEKDMLVNKLRAARQRIRAKGQKCEGRKSYQEAMPEVIREIRRLRRKRKGMRRRRTFEVVAEMLNEQGFRTANNTHFTGNTVRGIMHRLK